MRSLREIANDIEDFAARMQQFIPEEARTLRSLADEVTERHDHADPCEDESCPCYKAAMDNEHDQGRGPQ